MRFNLFFALGMIGGVVIFLALGGASIGVLAAAYARLGEPGLLIGVPLMLSGFVVTLFSMGQFWRWCDCQASPYLCDRRR